jgi:dolichyl-phosphate beta-glucosyltransferase
MMRARGEYLLFADADGATKFSDIKALEAKLNHISETTKCGVVIGSRAHLVQTDAVVKVTRILALLVNLSTTIL